MNTFNTFMAHRLLCVLLLLSLVSSCGVRGTKQERGVVSVVNNVDTSCAVGFPVQPPIETNLDEIEQGKLIRFSDSLESTDSTQPFGLAFDETITGVDASYIAELLAQPPIEINLDKIEQGRALKFSDIFALTDSIQLTGFEFGMTDFTHRIVADKESILIVSGGVFPDILAFDIHGKFLCKLGKQSMHDQYGAYKSASDIAVDSPNGIVYVLDNENYTILKYRKDGSFMGNIELIPGVFSDKFFYTNYLCDAITTDPQGRLLVHYNYYDGNQVPYNYYLYDAKGALIATKKSFHAFDGTTGDSKGIQRPTQAYYYRDLLHIKDESDTLYCVAQGQFVPKYVFTGKLSMSQAVLSREFQKFPAITTRLLETDDYLMLWYKSYEKTGGINAYISYYVYFDKHEYKCHLIAKGPESQIRFFDNVSRYLPRVGPDNDWYSLNRNTGVLKKYTVRD